MELVVAADDALVGAEAVGGGGVGASVIVLVVEYGVAGVGFNAIESPSAMVQVNRCLPASS